MNEGDPSFAIVRGLEWKAHLGAGAKDVMKRIAFFGGSFDPPHRGHLAIAKAAGDRFSLDEILFAPVATQPLKNQSSTPFVHRYAMTVLATQADSRFIPSLLDGPHAASIRNYTVETLERLRASFSEKTSLFTLLGADSWLQIAEWKDVAHLLALSDWIVAARPGFSLADAENALPAGVIAEKNMAESSLLLRHDNAESTHVFFMLETLEDISGTEFRGGRADSSVVPEAVREYIRKANLYAGISSGG